MDGQGLQYMCMKIKEQKTLKFSRERHCFYITKSLYVNMTHIYSHSKSLPVQPPVQSWFSLLLGSSYKKAIRNAAICQNQT